MCKYLHQNQRKTSPHTYPTENSICHTQSKRSAQKQRTKVKL